LRDRTAPGVNVEIKEECASENFRVRRDCTPVVRYQADIYTAHVMAYRLILLLLSLFAITTNSFPVNPVSTPSTLAIRGEAQSDNHSLSDEAIIGIAAIFASVFLFILSLALPASRKQIMAYCGGNETTGSTSGSHVRWYRSRE
jgi:hypothetical protein